MMLAGCGGGEALMWINASRAGNFVRVDVVRLRRWAWQRAATPADFRIAHVRKYQV
jgi:hypothetical protein